MKNAIFLLAISVLSVLKPEAKAQVAGLRPKNMLASNAERVPATAEPSAPQRVALPSLTGKWTGPLAIPGRSLAVALAIAETNGHLAAVLETSAVQLNHHTLTLTQRHDTLCFFDAAAQASYTCQRSADGKQLVGTWEQPGFRQALVLSSESPLTVSHAALPLRTTRWSSGHLQGNAPVGEWRYYRPDANGQPELAQVYDHSAGRLLFGSPDGLVHKAEVNPGEWQHVMLTQAPWFVGGPEALAQYLDKLQYPATALGQQVQGRVTVSFLIDTLGRASSHAIVRGLGAGCDEEALRVARTIPNAWTPGRIGTRAVAVMHYVYFNFRLP